jgi:hypothetical protein
MLLFDLLEWSGIGRGFGIYPIALRWCMIYSDDLNNIVNFIKTGVCN